jgi:phospholipid/cholesterol/gamma-HCH transport system substrate-binding protein
MENRSYALMTGFFTISLLVAAVFFGIWFNRDRAERVPYLISTTQSIPGLNPQADVRYRGLEVGKVAGITFDPRIAGRINIKLLIDPEAPVTRTTFASLGYQGVTGIAYVQLDDEQTGSPRLATSEKALGVIPLRPGLFDQLEKRGTAILERTEEITKKIEKLVSEENQKVILGAFDNVSKAAVAYGEIPAKLEPTLQRMPELARKMNDTADSVTNLAHNWSTMATRLQAPDGPIERMTQTMDRVGGIASDIELQTLPHLVAMTDEARSSLRAVKRTANSLSDRPQSILFGKPDAAPGPGEPGFTPPTK